MILLNNIFSQINTMLLAKQTFCILKKNKISRSVIKLLLQIGLLKRVQILTKFYLVKFNTFNSWGTYGFFFKLQNISTRSRKVEITTYSLKGLTRISDRNIYILANNQYGIVVSFIATELSFGGLLLARLLKL